MHNGSVPTLEAVIDLYNRGGVARPSRSELIRPLGLTDEEKSDLIAFLRTLTSDRPSSQPAPPR
jgi:cytochrome c peroxidase